MAKTLMLWTEDTDAAWEMLGELAGLYGDNGGNPDGNAWLPSDTITEEEATEVLEAGYGEMVEVLYADNNAMLRHLGAAPVPDDEELEEETIEQMQEAADKATNGWAHYGSYSSGTWVFIPLRELGGAIRR